MSRSTLHLASASPRRRELLQTIGQPFTAGVAPVDEKHLEGAYDGPVDGLAEYLAREKGKAALEALANRGDRSPVLTADTTVLLAGRVLGKPIDTVEATVMLRSLRGRTHTVVTGVALGQAREEQSNRHAPQIRSASMATRVHMRAYSDDEVAAYVASGDPLDKAGAYGVQHAAFQPVESVEGCYLTVVGLPLCAVAALMAEVGLPVARPSMPATADPTQFCPWSQWCRAPLPQIAIAGSATGYNRMASATRDDRARESPGRESASGS